MYRLCGLLLCATLATTATAAEPPRVSLEVVTERGLSATAPQKWQRALAGLGISGLRIRSATATDEIGVEQSGSRARPSYQVVGLLSAQGVLYVPGGQFTLRDVGKLRTWLDNLRADGPEGVTSERSAFGLTPSRLKTVHDDLSQPVVFSTEGASATKVLGRIAGQLAIPFSVEPGARRALAGVEVADELRGIASGTALAAILRPAGLVLVPRRERGGQLEYRVGRPVAGREVWPVGWKPQRRRNEVLPSLFEMLNVEIREISIAAALAAIEGRLEVPFLFDRNAMALHNADPAAIEAEVPEKRMSYSQVLRRVLSQGKLKYELRVDEADKPFLWITTVKPAP